MKNERKIPTKYFHPRADLFIAAIKAKQANLHQILKVKQILQLYTREAQLDRKESKLCVAKEENFIQSKNFPMLNVSS